MRSRALLLVAIAAVVACLFLFDLCDAVEEISRQGNEGTLTIKDEGVCTYGQGPDRTDTLFDLFSYYMWDIRGPLERGRDRNPCPLTKTLESLIAGQIPHDENKGTFDFVRETLIRYASGGLFAQVEESLLELSNDPGTPWKSSRSIMGHLQVSALDIDTRFRHDQGCPLARGWPMQWRIRSRTNRSEESILNIVALHVRKESDGTYRTLSNSSSPSWETLLRANVKFLERAGFTSKNATDKKEGSEVTRFHFEVPNSLYTCSIDYFEKECPVLADSTDRNCEDWGSRCGFSNVIEIDGKTGEGMDSTHIIYLPARAYAVVNGNDNQDITSSLARNKFAYLRSLRRFPRDSRAVAGELKTLWQQLQLGYVPHVVPEQDPLTFLVLFLTCLSEWVFSNPLWSWRAYKSFRRQHVGLTRGDIENIGLDELERRKRKLPTRFLMLLPTLITFIPLVIGLVLSWWRQRAIAGIMVGGYAFTPYVGLSNTDPDFQDFLKGRTFTKTFVYSEDNGFESLGKLYLAALCGMTVLIFYTLGSLAVEAWIVYRPQIWVEGNVRTDDKKPVEESDKVEKEGGTELSSVASSNPTLSGMVG